MSLDELKLRRKKFVSLALTADCGDDYWNDVDEIDRRISRMMTEVDYATVEPDALYRVILFDPILKKAYRADEDGCELMEEENSGKEVVYYEIKKEVSKDE